MLASGLAVHFGTLWVPEYAREFLEANGPEYREEDILTIARNQLEKEKELERSADQLLFCDTEFLVLKIWSMVKYGRCNTWILDQIEKNPYDLYLLCDIDLPWEYDPLREHPNRRQELLDLYLSELRAYRMPFALIRGKGRSRLDCAVDAMQGLTGVISGKKPGTSGK